MIEASILLLSRVGIKAGLSKSATAREPDLKVLYEFDDIYPENLDLEGRRA